MAEGDNDSEKTEEPTQRRLEEAYKKGNVPNSREITHLFILSGFLLMISVCGVLLPKIVSQLARYIEYSHDESLVGNISNLLKLGLYDYGTSIALPLLLLLVLAISSSMLQYGRIIWSAEPLMPKLSKISPLAGLKRIFSSRSIFELIKNLVKLALVLGGTYLSLKGSVDELSAIHAYSLLGILLYVVKTATQVLIGMLLIIVVIAGLDYFYQRFQFMKQMRMTKQELKEEYKATEGNPEVKAKLKAIRRERAKNRISQVVPKASVIITNPTHYSIALEYDSLRMNAPIVIAKGVDDIALVIREIAREHNIPLVENQYLARALYKQVKIGQEIPLEHYEAVAKIISYIYRLRGKMPSTGIAS